MEPALSIIQGGKNDEREYLPEYKIFVAIYLYTNNPLNAHIVDLQIYFYSL